METDRNLDRLIELFAELGGILLSATEQDAKAFGNSTSVWGFGSFILKVTYDRGQCLIQACPSFLPETCYDIIDLAVLVGALSPTQIRAWDSPPPVEYWVEFLREHYKELNRIFSKPTFEASKQELGVIEQRRVSAFENMLRETSFTVRKFRKK